MLHPEYIYNRMKQIQQYKTKILLCLIDVVRICLIFFLLLQEDNVKLVQEITKLCVVADYTLVVTWRYQC